MTGNKLSIFEGEEAFLQAELCVKALREQVHETEAKWQRKKIELVR